MITTVDDIRQAKRHIEIAKEELDADGSSFTDNFQLGAMVEVPAAAIATPEILAEVDFISVGTNDLLQYFMAADRDNESVLQYGRADNDAFVWLLRHIIDQAEDLGRENDVTICGEMASQLHFVPLLLQLGYRSLSISPVAAGRVRDAVASIDLGELVDRLVH
jgi:phosphotransferase system enzyme I (PtsI)